MYRVTWRLPLAGLVAYSHLQFSQIRGRQPYLIVRNILYVIREILAETPDATQRDDLARGLVLGVGRDNLVTLGLDLPDQLQDRNKPSTQAVQFGPKMARHLAPVTGAQDGKIALT